MDVHETYYRSLSSTIERGKVAKLLVLADEGRIGKYSGQSLSEIEFDGEF